MTTRLSNGAVRLLLAISIMSWALAASASPASPPMTTDKTAGVAQVQRGAVLLRDGRPVVLPVATTLTAAESVALSQVLASGRQTLGLSITGAANGGYLLINPTTQALQNLVIPEGVTAIANAANGPVNILGNITNAGSIFVLSTNPSAALGTINAARIVNASSGSISTIIPANVSSLVPHARTDLSLALNATDSIVNAGNITSAKDIFIKATSITNSGVMAAERGKVVLEANSNELVLNNEGGTVQAGTRIDLLTGPSIPGEKSKLSVTGGTLDAPTINVSSLGGKVNLEADELTGSVRVDAGDAVVGTERGGLKVSRLNLTGDPLLYSNAFGLPLVLTGFSNLFKTNGADFVVLSGGDIIYSGAAATIDASNAKGTGGQVYLGAGVTFSNLSPSNCTTCSFTITGNSSFGGSIVAPSLSLKTNNGAPITVNAHAGSAFAGNVNIANVTSFGLDGSGGSSGNINLSGNNVSIGAIKSTGGNGSSGVFGGNTGKIDIAANTLTIASIKASGGNGGSNAGGGIVDAITISGSGSVGSISGSGGTGGCCSNNRGGDVKGLTINGNLTTAGITLVTGSGGSNKANGNGGSGGNLSPVTINGNLAINSITLATGSGGYAYGFAYGGNGGDVSGLAIAGNLTPLSSKSFALNVSAGAGGGGASYGGTGGTVGPITINGNTQADSISVLGGSPGGSVGDLFLAGTSIVVNSIKCLPGSGGAGGKLVLVTTEDIGSATAPLVISSGQLEISSASNIFIQSPTTINFATSSAQGTSFVITGIGDVLTNSGASLSSGKTLTINTTGNIGNSSNRFAYNASDVQFTGKNVFISSPTSAAFSRPSSATQVFDILSNGDITNTINGTLNARSLALTSTTGNISLTGITTSELTANAPAAGKSVNITATSGAKMIGASAAAQNFSIVAAGNITADPASSITATSIALTANGGSIGSSLQPIVISAASVTASANGAGRSIFLQNNSPTLDVYSSSASSALSLISAGSINVPAGETLTATNVVLQATGGSLNLAGTTNGSASISFSANNTIADANVGTFTTPTLTVTSAAGSININIPAVVTRLTASAPNGNVTINSAGSVTLFGTPSANGNWSLTAANNISEDDNVNVTANLVSLTATSGNISNFGVNSPGLVFNAPAGSATVYVANSTTIVSDSGALTSLTVGGNNLYSDPGVVISASDVNLNLDQGSFQGPINGSNSIRVYIVSSVTNPQFAGLNTPKLYLQSDGDVGDLQSPFVISAASVSGSSLMGNFSVKSASPLNIGNASSNQTTAFDAPSIALSGSISGSKLQITTEDLAFVTGVAINATSSVSVIPHSTQALTINTPGTISAASGNILIGASNSALNLTGSKHLNLNAQQTSLIGSSFDLGPATTVSNNTGHLKISSPNIFLHDQSGISVLQPSSKISLLSPMTDLNVTLDAGKTASIVGSGIVMSSGSTGNVNLPTAGATLSIDKSALSVTAHGNVVLESSVVSTSDVMIHADQSIAGTGQLSAGRLDLTALSGGIGGSSAPFKTSAAVMRISSGGDSYVTQAGGPLTVESSFSDGSFNLTTAQSVTLNSITANTSISVVAQTQGINVLPNSILYALSGNILLNAADAAAGKIEIGKNAQVVGVGSLANTVVLCIGTPPSSPIAGSSPKNIIPLSAAGGQLFFGAQGITALAPANTVSANGRDVIFSTGTASASAIKLDGGVRITATSIAPLKSLDLTDKNVVAFIVNGQNQGLLGGQLLVDSDGIAVGGNVILEPFDFFRQIDALVVPAHVTMTMSQFRAADSIQIDIRATSTTPTVLVNGNVQFVGTPSTTFGNLQIISDQNTSGLVVGGGGQLTSTGGLSLQINRDLSIAGAVSSINTLISDAPGSNANLSLTGSIGSSSSKSTVTIQLDGTGNLVTNTVSGIRAATIALSTETGAIGSSTSGVKLTGNTFSLRTSGAGNVYADAYSLSGSTITLGASSAGAVFSLSDPKAALQLSGPITAGSSIELEVQQKNSISTTGNGIVLSAPTLNLLGVQGNFGSAKTPLSLATAQLNLSTTGNIYLTNNQSTTVAGVLANTFSLSNKGNINVTGSLPAASVALTTTPGSGGNINLSKSIGSPKGAVTLNSDGGIALASGTISGTTVNLQSANGSIGTALAPVSVATTTLSANAAQGSVWLRSTGNVTINAKAASTLDVTAAPASSGTTAGTVTIGNTFTAKQISLSAADQKIVLSNGVGQFGATVSINMSGTGTLSQNGGVITGNSLTLNGGSVVSASRLRTAVSSLTANINGTLNVSNSGPLKASVFTGGDILLSATGDLAADRMISANGSVKLVSSGLLELAPGSTLRAGNGNVYLQSTDTAGGTIKIGPQAVISASGAKSNLGNISIFVGASAPAIAGTKPQNVVTQISAPGKIFFGKNGITAEPPNNSIYALGKTVTFSTGLNPANVILLGGDVRITAASPATPVDAVQAGLSECEFIVDTEEDSWIQMPHDKVWNYETSRK